MEASCSRAVPITVAEASVEPDAEPGPKLRASKERALRGLPSGRFITSEDQWQPWAMRHVEQVRTLRYSTCMSLPHCAHASRLVPQQLWRHWDHTVACVTHASGAPGVPARVPVAERSSATGAPAVSSWQLHHTWGEYADTLPAVDTCGWGGSPWLLPPRASPSEAPRTVTHPVQLQSMDVASSAQPRRGGATAGTGVVAARRGSHKGRARAKGGTPKGGKSPAVARAGTGSGAGAGAGTGVGGSKAKQGGAGSRAKPKQAKPPTVRTAIIDDDDDDEEEDDIDVDEEEDDEEEGVVTGAGGGGVKAARGRVRARVESADSGAVVKKARK